MRFHTKEVSGCVVLSVERFQERAKKNLRNEKLKTIFSRTFNL